MAGARGDSAGRGLFLLFGYLWTPAWLVLVNVETLPAGAARVFAEVGADEFTRRNTFMLGIFMFALVLWTTQSLPNYMTSLIVIIALVLTGVLSERTAYAQLGHPIMWLNIMSFILASMLVKTGLAKRFTLWFLLRFGHSASSVFLSFIVINVAMSAFISATTAKAAILLPVFMVIAAIYGARPGNNGKTNFGRNIVLQQLLNINLGAGAFVTGSGANLLAAALISGAITGGVFFADWMLAMLPTMVGLMLLGYIIGMKIVFPLEEREKMPQIEGGMERLREEQRKLGPVRWDEIRAAVIFVTILAFWATDKLHGISPTAVAFVGAIVALLPRVGCRRVERRGHSLAPDAVLGRRLHAGRGLRRDRLAEHRRGRLLHRHRARPGDAVLGAVPDPDGGDVLLGAAVAVKDHAGDDLRAHRHRHRRVLRP
jgi:solute carrier family 13 (sodium-dependent dicarboxylate transporter), member 2/3/5